MTICFETCTNKLNRTVLCVISRSQLLTFFMPLFRIVTAVKLLHVLRQRERERRKLIVSYVYWTVHHLDSWIKRDQLDVTCFIISLFNAQHVSDVNTLILRSLRLICWVISWVVLLWFDVCWCYVVVWLWWYGIRMHTDTTPPQPSHNVTPTHIEPEQYNPWNSRKLLRMGVLTSETCWALNNEIIKQVTSTWSLFIQLLPLIPYVCIPFSRRAKRRRNTSLYILFW